MSRNAGGIDRIIRVLLGVTLIGATIMEVLPVWGWIGVIPLATGLLGLCPAYSLLGINTCAVKVEEK